MNDQEAKTVRQTCGTVCSVCLSVVMGALLLSLFLVSQGHLKVDDLLLVLKGLQASPYNPLAIAVPMLEVHPIPRPAPSRRQHRAGGAQQHIHAKPGCPRVGHHPLPPGSSAYSLLLRRPTAHRVERPLPFGSARTSRCSTAGHKVPQCKQTRHAHALWVDGPGRFIRRGTPRLLLVSF